MCGIIHAKAESGGVFMKVRSARSRLSREMLGIIAGSAAVSLFFFGFLRMTAGSLADRFLYETGVEITVYERQTLDLWITGLAFAAAVVLFVVTALVVMGKKISYINEIIAGIEALRQHRFDGEVSLEGSNELTDLAESINHLAETERELRQREVMLAEAKNRLIRSISHDIRTPLTSVISYTELLMGKESITEEELRSYLELVSSKSEQIRWLSGRLLDEEERTREHVTDGRLLIEQLLLEWESMLEDDFRLETDTSRLEAFSGDFAIGDMRRIFDNLASNISKYADSEYPVYMAVEATESELVIRQSNHILRRDENSPVESRGIGLLSVEQIAGEMGGELKVSADGEVYSITILLKL